MLIAGFFGIALSSASANAQPETLYVDASHETGVTTQTTLVAGTVYLVQIRGSISKWSPHSMASLCAGTPDPSPAFPSPGVTGPASVDAEWVWAWPKDSHSLCPHDKSMAEPPVAERSVFVSLGSNAKPEPLPHPAESAMTSNHVYTYKIVGQGAPAVFVVNDHFHRDNYGQLQITVTPPSAAP
jgi:hypothetical protein